MTSPKRPATYYIPRRAAFIAACLCVANAGCTRSTAAESHQNLASVQQVAPASSSVPAGSPGLKSTASRASGDPAHPAPDGSAAASLDEHSESSKRPLRTAPTDVPRVYAKARNVWIRGEPSTANQWIGFLWIGNSVKLRSTEAVSGPGCAKWYAIEPRGYVCVDEERATLNPDDPVIKQLFGLAPNPELATPHPFYGESMDAQRYHELPTEEQQRAREWDYRLQMGHIRDALSGKDRHASLEGVDLTPAPVSSLLLPDLPRTLQMGRKRLIRRSTVAWTREVPHEGRTFLLTDDFTWVPKDRVRPFEPVSFRGLWLGKKAPPSGLRKAKLPLAFFRGEQNSKYARTEDGTFSQSGESYPRLSWVALTGKKERFEKQLFHETVDGVWVVDQDAAIPEPREKTPWGAPVFGKDETKLTPKGRQTWIDVSVLGGWLLAYEGTEPIFATMVSPGRGGPPQGEKDPIETASTPTGWFKITGKFLTATMVAPNDLVHSAVPWAQNFSGPHALHGAYWHNNWGRLQSGGCVNVSPEDGRFLFGFTEPKIPDGWHGVRWDPNREPATIFIVKR